MILHELTSEQRNFAEEHHDIITRFLCNKRLSDDYYDVVVFGYLRAVQQYCIRPGLREKCAFGVVAMRNMNNDLVKHLKAQSRSSQKAATVSLETLLYGSESSVPAEVVAVPNRVTDNPAAKLLWEDIAGRLNADQLDILRLRADGYSDCEIAAGRKRRISDIKAVFSGIHAAVSDLCFI